ncbi:hypothetical protein T11_18222 [Trichinella zimbabwensis]|uniref:Uncharacterized protein n=1 Tax=Trichinella zimbabwensis TaxID=268475 RepID=A0A0V1HB74_9BILA|nr:hypothetical protein T11_18222 [Trichinella zimbabwensis]
METALPFYLPLLCLLQRYCWMLCFYENNVIQYVATMIHEMEHDALLSFLNYSICHFSSHSIVKKKRSVKSNVLSCFVSLSLTYVDENSLISSAFYNFCLPEALVLKKKCCYK